MKRSLLVLSALTIVTLTSNSSLAQSQSPAAAGFEKLKSLVGEWQGQGANGEQAKISYQLISGGTALMETLQPTNEPNMVTIYHLDRDRLMMTHYCSSGNQPRLAAAAPAGEIKSLNFALVDVANLTKPSAGHISNLVLTFQDPDHLKQTWGYRMDGKEVAETFTLERKK